ncbi:DNA-directed DNA/RNA polymerase mu-like [Artemia franciscana]|uniref:DNA-directed DNA/RNA polymerase mu-like n=1 Tax=Artemia franciscana TaxID=6661 RepID=UPI0032D9FAF0
MSHFSDYSIYILPYRIQSKRYGLILKIAENKGYRLSKEVNCDVTHLITELPDYGSIKKYISGTGFNGKIVRLAWFLDSNRLNSPQPEGGYEILPTENYEVKPKKSKPDFDLRAFNACVPDRKARLEHPNKNLSEPLDILRHYWEVMGQTEVDANRELAFMKAAATIKCLPFKVEDVQQVRGIKDLGEGHCFKVVKEVLETGKSEEVEEKKADTKFAILDSFMEVFNSGKAKAKEWYNEGYRSVWDLRNKYKDKEKETDVRIMFGLAFYEDLTTPVKVEEGKNIFDFVSEVAQSVLPGITLNMIGGFRRGKSSGHDVDILFTHEEEGREQKFGPELAKELDRMNLIMWHQVTHSPENSGKLKNETILENKVYLTMTMFKYPLDGDFSPWKNREEGPKEFHAKYTGDSAALFELADSNRSWKAVRVDFVTAPKSQWATALMGWTGNKNYNRIFRQYASAEKGLAINNSCVFNKKTKEVYPVGSEEDIFKHAGISYHDPTERNF